MYHFAYVSICLCVCLAIYLPMHLSVWLSVCLSVCVRTGCCSVRPYLHDELVARRCRPWCLFDGVSLSLPCCLRCSVMLLFALILSHFVMRCYGSVRRRFLSAGSPFCRRSVVMILSCYLSFVDSCAVVCVQRNVVVCLDLKSFRHALLWLRAP